MSETSISHFEWYLYQLAHLHHESYSKPRICLHDDDGSEFWMTTLFFFFFFWEKVFVCRGRYTWKGRIEMSAERPLIESATPILAQLQLSLRWLTVLPDTLHSLLLQLEWMWKLLTLDRVLEHFSSIPWIHCLVRQEKYPDRLYICIQLWIVKGLIKKIIFLKSTIKPSCKR